MGIAGKRIGEILHDGAVVAAVVDEMTAIGLAELRAPQHNWLWVAPAAQRDALERFEKSRALPWGTGSRRNMSCAPIAGRIALSAGRYGGVIADPLPMWARDMLSPVMSELADGTREEAAVARDWLIEHTTPAEMWDGVTLVRGYMIRVVEG